MPDGARPHRRRRVPAGRFPRGEHFPETPGMPYIVAMLGRLILLFTLFPILELYLLIQLGQLIGALPTVGIVLATGVLGAFLARREGFAIWTRIQEQLAQGLFPADDMIDGLMVFGAGVVLVTPGVITDILGILILFPPTRRPIRKFIAKRLRRMADTRETRFYGFSRNVTHTGTERDVGGDDSHTSL